MPRRLLAWLHQIIIALNQFVQVMVSGVAYVIRGGEMTADETISSKVGRMALTGKRWARIAEWIIDRLLWGIEGGRLGHCRRAIEPRFADADDAA